MALVPVMIVECSSTGGMAREDCLWRKHMGQDSLTFWKERISRTVPNSPSPRIAPRTISLAKKVGLFLCSSILNDRADDGGVISAAAAPNDGGGVGGGDGPDDDGYDY